MSGVLERLWYPRGPLSWVQRLLLAPLLLLSLAFRGVVVVRAWLYATGRLRVHHATRARVISVGNLTVGGAGKTPAVIHLAQRLTRRGVRVAVLTRGYGRKASGVRVLAPGEDLPSAEEVGDEPLVIARRCPQVHVLVGPDRAALASVAERQLGAEVLLLDDGFQHLRLARDVDVVVVDEAVGLGNGQLLPCGPLREPVQALSRASLLWMRSAQELRRLPLPPVPVLRAAYEAGGLSTLEGTPLGGESLRGQRVLAFAGIARPERFAATLRERGAEVVQLVEFGDHHAFTRAELARLVALAARLDARLVTTEKDAARLPARFPCWVLGLEVKVLEGDALLDALLDGGEEGSRPPAVMPRR
ncbi:MAG: tetraacyldisaccharide 4'-kinase [Myxococcaceae bacterium]|nr:tetraacyldisaccharide 4'-kinase [Myxococcaceae bacterium]MCI0673236.1 tetraacyldisaccharide 4'-kinase [Myxococcaceae bacterium]